MKPHIRLRYTGNYWWAQVASERGGAFLFFTPSALRVAALFVHVRVQWREWLDITSYA